MRKIKITVRRIAVVPPIFISAEKFKNGPSAKNMPNGIKEDAISIWKYVTKKFGKRIQEGKNLNEQWAVAVIIFKNICTQRGVMPFDFDILQIQKEAKIPSVTQKVKKSVKKAQSFIKKLLDTLFRDKFLDKSFKSRWVFDRTIYADGRYHVAVYKRLKLGENIPAKKLMLELSKHEFSKKPDSAFFAVDANTTISFEEDKQKDTIVFAYITLSFLENEAKDLTAKDTGRDLENRLTRVGKGLLL